jgi:hypothetical protein
MADHSSYQPMKRHQVGSCELNEVLSTAASFAVGFVKARRPNGVRPTATTQFTRFSVPFWEKSASNRATCRGARDRSGWANPLRCRS